MGRVTCLGAVTEPAPVYARQIQPDTCPKQLSYIEINKQSRLYVNTQWSLPLGTNPLGLSVYLPQYVDGSDGWNNAGTYTTVSHLIQNYITHILLYPYFTDNFYLHYTNSEHWLQILFKFMNKTKI